MRCGGEIENSAALLSTSFVLLAITGAAIDFACRIFFA
jgi:hypothetical protein